MKKNYFFIILFSILSFNSFSQVHTWTGNGDNYFWSDPDNWDQGFVPLANGVGTVIIPESFEVHSTSSINFEYGEFKGGGTFINSGELNLINSDEVLTSKIFSNITILSPQAINIYRANGISNTDPILLNEGAHIISSSLTINNIGISFNTAQPGFLEISSDFEKIGDEDVLIDVEIKICCGNFEVSEGLLTIEPSTSNTILSPYFDIHEGASLILKGNTILDGYVTSITGNIAGYLEITNGATDNPSVSHTFFFDAEGEITFKDVTFQGNGTFHGRVNTFLPENSTVTFDGPKFSNQEIFRSNSQSSILLKNGSVFTNVNNGEMILNGGSIEGINNEEFKNGGLISIINNTEYEIIGINFENSGTIGLQGGSMILDDNSFFYNQSEFAEEIKGEIIGPGNFKFPSYNANTIENGGIFSLEVGINEINTENFSQTSNGFIRINIEDLYNFDKVTNTGTTFFEGGFEVSLDFAPSIGDEFLVYQSDTPLTNCQPDSTTIAEFNNFNYVFDVICNTDYITIRLTEIVLANNDFELLNNSFYCYPNPVSSNSNFTISPELLTIENNSILIYNYLGQLVKEIEINNKDAVKFNKGKLPSGLYFAKLKSNNKTIAITKLVLV